MHFNCAKSCGTCEKVQKSSKPRGLQSQELLAATEQFGKRQKAQGGEEAATLALIKESLDYMQSDRVMSLPQKFREGCRNTHELCSFWSVVGALHGR